MNTSSKHVAAGQPRLTAGSPRIVLFLTGVLILSLASFVFFFFVVNKGGTGTSLNVCTIALLLLIAVRAYNPWEHRYVLGAVLITSVAAVPSLLVPWSKPDAETISMVFHLLCVALSVHYLSTPQISAGLKRSLRYAILAMLLGVIVWQFILSVALHSPYGAYLNPHHLGCVSILTLPLVFYFICTADQLQRILFFAAGALNVVTLILAGSRPAWISITLSSFLGILVFARGRRKWIGLFALAGCILLLLTFHETVKTRMTDLAINIEQEERVLIWTEAVGVLKENTPAQWVMGHGIGSVREIRYPSHPALNFPHNFFLEILYDNGLFGVILIPLPLIYLLVRLMRAAGRMSGAGDKILLGCLTTAFIAWFFHASVVFPFYSKYSLYPFSLILGIMISCGERLRYGDAEGTGLSREIHLSKKAMSQGLG